MGTGALGKLAIATLALATLLGVYAYRLSRELAAAERPAPAPDTDLPRVVVAARDLEAGTVVRAADVTLAPIGMAPAGSFERVRDAIERVSSVDLVAGEPILARHFVSPSALRRSLLPGERALAVKVDGVIGLGGFVEPGDRVDVLLYLAKDGREIGASQARLLLPDLRVLAYGARTLGDGGDGAPSEARTAVLAVAEAQAPLLMLGASRGRLRLALRAGEGIEAESVPAGNGSRVATLAELIGERRKAAPAPARPRVRIHRGIVEERVR